MANTEISDLKRIFTSRLDTLNHILNVAEKNLPDMDAALKERLAPDMFPLGTQIAFACNQPRLFAQWSAGQPAENIDGEVNTIAVARSHIQNTKVMVAAVQIDDSRLDEMKRTGLGPDYYCETSARLFVSEFAIPNFYFHISMAYAIFRKLGVPVGKADYMNFLIPHVRPVK